MTELPITQELADHITFHRTSVPVHGCMYCPDPEHAWRHTPLVNWKLGEAAVRPSKPRNPTGGAQPARQPQNETEAT